MKTSTWTIALLSLSVAMPLYAQRGGGGGGRGNRNQGFNGGQGGLGVQVQDAGNGIDVNQAGTGQNNFGGGGGRGGRANRNLGGGGLVPNVGNGMEPNQGVGQNNFGGAGRGGRNGGAQPAMGGRGRGRNIPSQAPEDYSILNTVSIFSKDRVVYEPDVVDDQVRQQEIERQARRNQGPIPTFVGVMKVDAGYVALINAPSFNGVDNLLTIHPGESIPWDGSVVKNVTMDKIFLMGGQFPEISLGYNLHNEPVQPAYVAPAVVSQDVFNRGNMGGGNGGNFNNQGYNNQGFGGQGFGGRGGRGRNGGGQYGAGGNQQFGIGGNPFGVTGTYQQPGVGGAQFTPPAIVAPAVSVDPPLPPGSVDDIVARMAARRAAQINSGN